jgi:hypothetical protein
MALLVRTCLGCDDEGCWHWGLAGDGHSPHDDRGVHTYIRGLSIPGPSSSYADPSTANPNVRRRLARQDPSLGHMEAPPELWQGSAVAPLRFRWILAP